MYKQIHFNKYTFIKIIVEVLNNQARFILGKYQVKIINYLNIIKFDQ